MHVFVSVAFMSAILGAGLATASTEPPLVRSAASGRWSNAATWQGGKVPGNGSRVQVMTGHVVTYDIKTDGDPIDPCRRDAEVRPWARHAPRRWSNQDSSRG